MFDWMRRNNKKLLAVFTVGLMIAFVFTPQSGPGDYDSAYALGQVNGRPLMQQEVAGAQNVWNYLQNSIFVMDQQGPVPLVMFLGRTSAEESPALGQQVARQIEDSNVMLYLLLDEARRMGVTVSDAEIINLAKVISIRVPDETSEGKGARFLDYETIADKELGNNVRAALYQFLLLQKSFSRASSRATGHLGNSHSKGAA